MRSGDRLRATYAFAPVDRFHRREFYIWQEAIDRWKTEGLPDDYQEQNLFMLDPAGDTTTGVSLGWCEPPFLPGYEDKLIRAEGETEIIQDNAGRWLRVFKGRRHGFMPDYVKHPVTSMADWETDVAPRLDPDTRGRLATIDDTCATAEQKRQAEDLMVRQLVIGGYMYLRALMGPEEVLLAFYDMPDVIHACMRQWLHLMDTTIARVQQRIELDELSLAEDICYNHGLLISPDTFRQFLTPYYQQLVSNARARQQRKMYLYVDTDGWALPAIPLYLEVGMDVMTPFEVASNCDVVQIGRQYPELVMAGGIDKRVLADSPEAIDAFLERVIPPMVRRGGYIPTCDHGVPDNVSFANYMHYRRRLCELDH